MSTHIWLIALLAVYSGTSFCRIVGIGFDVLVKRGNATGLV